ncbi:cell division protein SepF [Peptacetobacter sp.]|uniref:cell division protein SepF n=1 Tax=Peptacetobacter sp. TaxID=2991975 RepID=UPI002622D450|nr:cell division protein SepF [Peptacetobacter sp.]
MAKLIDKVKNMFNDDDLEYDEYEDEFEDDEEEIEEVAEDDEEVSDYNALSSNKKVGKVIDYPSGQMKVVIYAPKIYDEATQIADALKQRKTVVVNLDGVSSPQVKKSIFDFLNGAVYVLDGDIQKVAGSIFILAPNNVDIDASVKKELESRALFPWQK